VRICAVAASMGACFVMGCARAGSLSAAYTAMEAPGASEAHVRLVFVGDSGYVPDDEVCRFDASGAAEESCHISVSQRAALRAAIRATEPDAVYGLGDLVYPNARGCRQPRGRRMQQLAATIGSYYLDLGAPAYLVLGNHDVGHLASRDRRVRCLQAFAAGVEGLELPAAQYHVDHGLVRVVVPNSNLRDQALWPARGLQDAAASGDWVVVAAHHELRTAFQKLSEGPWESDGVGEWLVELGVVPHLWANGHAHALQLGAFDARTTDDGQVDADDPSEPMPVLALTSGSGSKLRANPTCTPDASDPCDGPDPRGLPAFALSRFGFAVVDVRPEAMTVRLVDFEGTELLSWTRTRSEVGPVSAGDPTP